MSLLYFFVRTVLLLLGAHLAAPRYGVGKELLKRSKESGGFQEGFTRVEKIFVEVAGVLSLDHA